jgi:hypothetical protein
MLIYHIVYKPSIARNSLNIQVCVVTGTQKCENPDPNYLSAYKFPCSGNLKQWRQGTIMLVANMHYKWLPASEEYFLESYTSLQRDMVYC